MKDPVIRKALTVTGWVQGVGFRWRARSAAAALGVSGWVRNNPDGSVSMELQGTEAQIDGVLLAIECGAYVRIENLWVKTLPVKENESGFAVLEDGDI